jgi:hypothetical protein
LKGRQTAWKRDGEDGWKADLVAMEAWSGRAERSDLGGNWSSWHNERNADGSRDSRGRRIGLIVLEGDYVSAGSASRVGDV